MLNLFLLLFIINVLISCLPIRYPIVKKYIYILQTIGLILFATFRGVDFDRDQPLYLYSFNNAKSLENLEYTFTIIVNTIKIFSGNFVWLLFIYALIGVYLKLMAIRKMTDFFFLSIVIYICNTYILQDLTQIRAAICSAFLLLSLIPLYDRNMKLFYLFAILAVSFHFSGIPILFLYFLDPKKINTKVWKLLLPLSYILLFIGFTPLGLAKIFSLELIQKKLEVYFNAGKEVGSEKVNVFNTLVIFRFIFTYILLFNIEKIYEKNKYAIILLKVYIISQILLVQLSEVTTLAMRFNELFGVVEMVVIPFVLYSYVKKDMTFVLLKFSIYLFAFMLLFFHFRAETLLIFKK
ncbi:EpsG family protein [Chryseobacterium ureilyticum]|uniref:EpsG family protein n=1 Tax=Chryseobacterium ureilyticum TaxID=373668 RepID=A0A1N7LWZ6_9FLAO|nr:EpsG family protein [Chryseobacterium ureilyticum]SIS78353.1 EpsG family protein [Chryseobacterium ureilyticum]